MAWEINDKTLISKLTSSSFAELINGEKSKIVEELFLQKLINEACETKKDKLSEDEIQELSARKPTAAEAEGYRFEHPLDEMIAGSNELLHKLFPASGDSIDYTHAKELDELWHKLIEKSIKCLRFFDSREPFRTETNKVSVAYGMDSLKKYHDRYTAFESMLYGESSYYRDHVFHAVRTWMLGIFCLLNSSEGNKIFINKIKIDGEEGDKFASEINFFEKISMWTIIALCHDLGYPLEKSENILNKTREMMKDFISKPNIWSNFEFGGIQDNINEYIIKFMSTKMKEKRYEVSEVTSYEREKSREYLGRIQPKYFLKYAKSLEGFNHGIISSVIVYKMLLYFLESDFNLNDDYIYSYEDAKQFYIRREILRAMSSHTCPDIYNIHITTFSSLLFVCDELQEWGRKSWNELYSGLNNDAIQLTIVEFNESQITIAEKINMEQIHLQGIAKNVARIFERQYSLYKTIFRDGQYTLFRDFNIKKEINIELESVEGQKNSLKIDYLLASKENSYFNLNINEAPNFKDELKANIQSAIDKLMYYRNEFKLI